MNGEKDTDIDKLDFGLTQLTTNDVSSRSHKFNNCLIDNINCVLFRGKQNIWIKINNKIVVRV